MARPVVAALGALVMAVGAAGAEEKGTAWEGAVSLLGYAAPGASDYLNPNVSADRGRLHLEARWNYEALDTGSLWGSANFSTGTAWVLDATVMLGAVHGELEGFAPGYRLSLGRSWFALASEGEYVLDVHDHSQDFLYSWNEITGSPVDGCRVGVAAQRTRAYQTGLDIQRGFTAGFTYRALDAAAYVFNPWSDETVYVLALSVTFSR